MSKREFLPSEALFPTPVVLVSCCNKDTNRANAVTVAWCGVVCSSPPQISISLRPSRYSHGLIKKTGDFVVNIPYSDIVKKVDLCGIVSGRESDKLALASLTQEPASKVSSPLIRACPVNIECRLKSVTNLGVHDLFIGEVVAVHVDESICDANGAIDFAKASPFVYNRGEYWDLGKKIGRYGFSRK
jgi:flavin reductase (DIM6/NTAB) family NADH-FMN oxidoreductase RutF